MGVGRGIMEGIWCIEALKYRSWALKGGAGIETIKGQPLSMLSIPRNVEE